MRGLEGVRVLELGEMVSAAYASKLIGDLGAEVIKVEEPGGDPARQRGPFPDDRVDAEKSGTFLALNTNKRGLSLDLVQDATACGNWLPRPISSSTTIHLVVWPSWALPMSRSDSSTPGW